MGKKIIVTHKWLDLDAVASVWLVRRFLPNWHNAEVQFVAAGKTLNNEPVDSNPNILHVDTGKGKFDHHQDKQKKKKNSAAQKIFLYLIKNNIVSKSDTEVLERIVNLVTFFDNFLEITFDDPAHDRYDMLLHQLIEALNIKLQNDRKVLEIGLTLMDALFILIKNKVRAEKELKKGYVFQTKWGKAIAVESHNEEVIRLGLKLGYTIVMRKDPKKGYLRIKASPISEVDLTKPYEIFKKMDPNATWFLHSTKKMLLNGSAKNPGAKPTKLTLLDAIEVFKKV